MAFLFSDGLGQIYFNHYYTLTPSIVKKKKDPDKWCNKIML